MNELEKVDGEMLLDKQMSNLESKDPLDWQAIERVVLFVEQYVFNCRYATI